MRVSVIQPEIVRGDIDHNVKVINRQLERCEGELIVLAEYALTGSLVLDQQANPYDWAKQSDKALSDLVIPAGKTILINHLTEENGQLFNESTFLPSGGFQRKCFPDKPELDAGIRQTSDFPLFTYQGRRFKIIICSDLRSIDRLPTDGADFLLFIFHFTRHNQTDALNQVKTLSLTRKLPVIIASLCSDQNCGHSAYVNGNTVVSLGDREGILEIEI